MDEQITKLAKKVKQNRQYLEWYEGVEGHEALVADLKADLQAAQQALADRGVFAV